MYIKNRRNSDKLMSSGPYDTLYLNDSLVLRIHLLFIYKRCGQFC